MIIYRKKATESILSKEPYATFIMEFDKLQSITNEKIHMRITSDDSSKKTELTSGFSLDYCYAKCFDLMFEFYGMDDADCIQNQQFCIIHSLSYKFGDDDYYDMMMDTVADIEKRNGYVYLSSLVQECEVRCSLNNNKTVTVTYSVFCDKNDVKEICLQLINHDIALFTRSF